MLLGTFLTPKAAGAPPVDFSGTWRNQLNSDMEIVQTGEEIRGSYRTEVGAPGNSVRFPLVGFATGDLIAFSVNFGEYGSLTGWTGQHTVRGNQEEIQTLWHLARNVTDPDEPDQLWSGILAGADTFVRA
jgi:hypothetical protein